MTLDELKHSFERDMRPLCLRRHWKIAFQESASELEWQITTPEYIHTITAKPDWIGCAVETRPTNPQHAGSQDLPDGKLTEETLQSIVEAIKAWEMSRYRGPGM